MPPPYYRIDLNDVPASLQDLPNEPLAVTPESPLKLRREVERFAIYFRREFGYDFQQFEATEKPDKPIHGLSVGILAYGLALAAFDGVNTRMSSLAGQRNGCGCIRTIAAKGF